MREGEAGGKGRKQMKWKQWLVLLLFVSGFLGFLFMDPLARIIYRVWVSERYYPE